MLPASPTCAWTGKECGWDDSVPDLNVLHTPSTKLVPPHLQIIIQPAEVEQRQTEKAVFHRFDLGCPLVISTGLCRKRDIASRFRRNLPSSEPREKEDGERHRNEIVHWAIEESQRLTRFVWLVDHPLARM
jgi:hypothetical protein